MSDTISKQALLEWLKDRADINSYGDYQAEGEVALAENLLHEVRSGAFDSVQGEVQRLRAALKEMRSSIQVVNNIVSVAIGFGEDIDYGLLSGELERLDQVAYESLSTTEPTGVDRVRE